MTGLSVPYSARRIDVLENGKGCWRSQRIGVFEGERQIGEYVRNYPAMVPFAPFMLRGEWYALASRRYTCTEIMRLPTCEWIGGETPQSGGFCPVDIYVPSFTRQSYETKDGRREYLTWDSEYASGNCPADEDFVAKAAWEHAPFALVAGCVWGDDSCWKVNAFDLRNADLGVLTFLQPFGYMQMVGSRIIDAIDHMDLDEHGSGYVRFKALTDWSGSIVDEAPAETETKGA